VIAAGAALQFSFGLVYVWGALAPLVRAEDGWPPVLIGAVWSAGPVGYGSGIVLAGRLADRLPPRRICWAAVALMAGGLGIALTVPRAWTFVLFYSALGLGAGGATALAGALAAGTSVLPARAGVVGGTLTGSYALAALVQVPVVTALAARLGWVDALRLAGSALVLLAVGAVALMPPLPRPRRATGSRERATTRELAGRRLVRTGFLLELTATPLGAYAFVNLAGQARGLGLPLAVSTATILAIASGNAAGRLTGGAASDRYGVHLAFLVILVCDLVAAVILWQASSPLALLLAGGLVGIAFGAPAGLLSRLATEAAPDAPHAAFGLLFTGYAAGAFTGPLLGAALGGGRSVWLALGALGLGGLVILAAGRPWQTDEALQRSV
jgi:MFS family permease